MQILVQTDNHIDGRESVSSYVESVIQGTLNRFDSHLTRIEAHLSDVNGDKGGADDVHCVLEARVEGRKPVAVTNSAGNLHDAVAGAAHKMEHRLSTLVEKMKHK